jgi:predicted nucleotidyltransferase
MDKKAALTAISGFAKALESNGIKPDKIILYGSFANDRFREGSDIDLIVISQDFEGKGYWERIDILSDAVYQVFQPIEAVAMTPKEWQTGDSLIAVYAREGEIVYG